MTNFITLNNGYQIPQLGFGTIQQFGKQIEDNVAFALNHGYQLIDTANRYGNEVEVGKGLKQSGLKREDYYLEVIKISERSIPLSLIAFPTSLSLQ